MKIWVHGSVIQAALAESEVVQADAQSVISRSDSTSSSSSDGFSSKRNSAWLWVKSVVVSGSASSIVANSPRTPAKSTSARFGSVDRQKSFTPGGGASSRSITAGNSDTILTIRVIDPDSLHEDKIVEISARHLKNAGGRGVLPANSFNDQGSLPSDLTQLTHLHEPAVVDCLHRRYQLSTGWEMYTSSGPILIAINPCRMVKGLYDENAMRMYWQRGERLANGSGTSEDGIASGSEKASLPPHVFAVADAAYRGMMRGLDFARSSLEEEKREDDSGGIFANQSILVSGESGAGKTVTTKFIMQYLAALSKKADSEHDAVGLDKKSSIEQRVLKSNAILESFGNARTLRNDNSSRFGKFIELRFSDRGRLMGASIDTYLLEKARIVSHTCGERSYHIFYQVLEKGSLSAAERKRLFIDNKSAADFAITTSDGGKHKSHLCQSGFDDHAKMFGELQTAMDTMGLSRPEQMEIVQAICGLLHLSNLTLQGAFSESNDGEECVLNQSNASLEPALRLLGVSYDALNAAVTTVQFKAVDELVKKNLNAVQAIRAVQALIKGAYDSIFSLLVNRINSCIVGSAEGLHSTAAFIGLLDIFGFESFDKNSFEQLCINYCNESLQQQFNRFVFKLEQEEYTREGIKWDFIEFSDNQDILDLIEKKHGGLLTILDEQCMLGMRCNDRTFVSAVYDKCLSASNRFDANTKQKAQGKFSIHHYAGLVEYDTDGFMEKNKDEIPMEAGELFANSSCPFIRDNLAHVVASKIHGKDDQQENKRRAFKSSISRVSVGGQFATQLQKLRRRIDETHPHYVRCLKPNDQLRPDRFDPNIVVDQLRCGGILEAIRVSRAGFPQRYTFEHFASRFGVLSLHLSETKCPRKPQSFTRAPTGNPLKRNTNLKHRADPKKDCEVLVKAIARWIVSEREKNNQVEEEPELEPDSLSPRSFWKSHQSPPKTKSSNLIHTPVEVSKVGMQVGATKVFLLQDTFDTIERMRGQVLAANATKIASSIRMYLCRKSYLATLRMRRESRKRFDNRLCIESKENDSTRSINTYVGCDQSSSFNHTPKKVQESEPQEFQWVPVGHGRFVKRGSSVNFDNFQAL